jgi:hypothetical protein
MSADHIVTDDRSHLQLVPSLDVQSRVTGDTQRFAAHRLELDHDQVQLDPTTFRQDPRDGHVTVDGVLQALVQGKPTPVAIRISWRSIGLTDASDRFSGIRIHPVSTDGSTSSWRHIETPDSVEWYALSQESSRQAQAHRTGADAGLDALRNHN